MKTIKFKNGELIKQKEGSKYSSILVEQTTLAIVKGLLLNQRRVSALSMPNEVISKLEITEGMDINKALGKLGLPELCIQRVQTLAPQYEGHEKASYTDEDTGEIKVMDYYVSFRVATVGTADIIETATDTVSSNAVVAEAGDFS